MISKDVKKYCKTYWLIENYEAAVNDKENVWHCHHRLEDRGWCVEFLKYIHAYKNVEPEYLIFIIGSEHIRQHTIGKKPSKETVEKRASKISGRKRTEEQREHMRNAQRKYFEEHDGHMKGRHLTEEHKRKIGDSQRGEKSKNFGKKLTEEEKKRLDRTGMKWTESQREKIGGYLKKRRKKVGKYSLDGELIFVYESVRDAIKDNKGAHVSDCCNGKRRKSNGFIFKFIIN